MLALRSYIPGTSCFAKASEDTLLRYAPAVNNGVVWITRNAIIKALTHSPH